MLIQLLIIEQPRRTLYIFKSTILKYFTGGFREQRKRIAFKLQNLGGKDILIDKFSVRGVSSPWVDSYVFRVPSGTAIDGDMNITAYAGLAGSGVVIDGNIYNQSSANIPLISGGELLVYIVDPDNIQLDDIGTSVSMSVSTNNAQYITEVNVESATTQ